MDAVRQPIIRIVFVIYIETGDRPINFSKSQPTCHTFEENIHGNRGLNLSSSLSFLPRVMSADMTAHLIALKDHIAIEISHQTHTFFVRTHRTLIGCWCNPLLTYDASQFPVEILCGTHMYLSIPVHSPILSHESKIMNTSTGKTGNSR